MEDTPYTPPKTNRDFTLSVDLSGVALPKRKEFRQPLQFKKVIPGGGGEGGGGECNDGLDGQDGAQTDCSGDCHAYFA
jgi:hypothetical protein